MNRRTTIWLIVFIVLVLGAAVVFSLSQNGVADNMCKGVSGTSQTITIQAGKPSTTAVKGRLCDKLTFMNKDNIAREIAFGPHENHVPYDGIGEKVLNKGQSFTITFNQAGTYHWHDHLHDEVQGYFTVTK